MKMKPVTDEIVYCKVDGELYFMLNGEKLREEELLAILVIEREYTKERANEIIYSIKEMMLEETYK